MKAVYTGSLLPRCNPMEGGGGASPYGDGGGGADTAGGLQEIRGMATKSEISRAFLERVQSEISFTGFDKLSKGTFLRTGSSDILEMVRFEFIGSGILEAVCYFGARVQSIENELSSMSFFADKGIKFSKMDQSIFQRADVATNVVAGIKEKSSFKVGSDICSAISSIINTIEILSPSFGTISGLSSYCLRDNNLPLGHHAFRVPLLLTQAGLKQECDDYVRSVVGKGFIADYEKFVEEFRQRLNFS